MQTLECPDCRKRYRIKGELSGKTLRCPNCSGELAVAAAGGPRSLRSSIREELQLLSVDDGPPVASGPPKPTVHVSEPAETSPGVRKALVAGLAALATIAVLGGGLWVYLALRPSAPPELPEEIRAAFEKARRVDVPGSEERALGQWDAARRMLLAHLMTLDEVGAFTQERQAAEVRINALRDILRRRRRGEEPAPSEPEPAVAERPAPEPAQAEEAPARERAAAPPRRPPQAPSERQGSPVERLRALTTRVRAASREGKARLVVDGPSEFLRWRAESWGNPLQLELDGEQGGEPAVALHQQSGDRGKWVISLDQPLDVTTYDSIAVDVEAREPVSMSVAFWTEPGSGIFESKVKTVRDGATFPVKGKDFKSQATQWQYGTEIQNPNNVTRISLFFYSRSQEPIKVRNLRLIRDT